jgi:hypothetical protein
VVFPREAVEKATPPRKSTKQVRSIGRESDLLAIADRLTRVEAALNTLLERNQPEQLNLLA